MFCLLVFVAVWDFSFFFFLKNHSCTHDKTGVYKTDRESHLGVGQSKDFNCSLKGLYVSIEKKPTRSKKHVGGGV